MSHLLTKRLTQVLKIVQGNAAAFTTPKPVFYSVITTESDPGKHTKHDLGLFYTIDNSIMLKGAFKEAYLNKKYIEECETFRNSYIMIRKPALEIINCLKHTNYDNAVNRYVLYGQRGHGVSMTMLHVLHFAYVSGWLIVHVPKLIYWLLGNTEMTESVTKKGLLDLPLLGSDWLYHFKCQNLNVINNLNLRLQNDFTWNIQEENKKGESLLSLVDHGIARGKYSCDVICGLLEEVQLLSKLGIVKTLVAIDNYDVIFHPARKSSNKKFRYLAPSQLSFMESFKNLALPNWHNGAVVLSCHSERGIASYTDHLPLNKLSLEGLEFLDPFIPIEVPKLTDLEMTNLLNFYRSQKWLLRSDADSEIKSLSSGCIETLKSLCGPL